MGNKYHAEPVMIDNIRFASKAEGRCYTMLRARALAGEISALTCHPRFPIEVNGVKVCTYVGDFQYVEKGRQVIADAKGGATTPVFKLKAKLMKACHGIDVLEIRV